jgi:uroporphyrin-III C-methyltransferase/precorrin-2 dehydrogenase/sirohydrochlorin ferrochelatase
MKTLGKNSNRGYSNKTLPVLLRDPKVLLIGGGMAASQKAKVLKANNIDFKIVSIQVSEAIKSSNADYKLKNFEKSDLDNFNIVIDATGNPEVNFILRQSKHERSFLLNSVDIPWECDFYFSSLLLYKNLKIAVSSDGGSPTLTQIVRDKIKDIIPEKIADIAEEKLNERGKGVIDVERTKKEAFEVFGKVFLIGCGPGDPELLTVKAVKKIEAADVILYDCLINLEILDFAKKGAEIFCVGKQKGLHRYKQEEINNIMLEYAKSGYKVARLKGGDPYIFGRGAEEAAFLINNNIDVEVVPGVSSAFAAPLLAGIPPTMRNYSSGISIVSGYKTDDNSDLCWLPFLKIKNHTTIVLMGLTKAEKIFNEGNRIGIDKDLPAAVISNASRKNQKVITSTFNNLLKISKDAEMPAVLVFGEVVKLSGELNLNVKLKNSIGQLNEDFRD